ncbi:MAG: hypothetical protein ABFE13_04560 [Phycisphaerales bacterium]
MESPTREDLARIDRNRPKKGSDQDWYNPNDPDARITKMKDGRTHQQTHIRILKRLLIRVAGCNPGLVMRTLFGLGTPRALQGLVLAFRRLILDTIGALQSANSSTGCYAKLGISHSGRGAGRR